MKIFYSKVLCSLCFFILLLPAEVLAKTKNQNVNSNFGFTMKVPQEWLVLTKEEVQDNSDSLVKAVNELKVDQSFLKQITDKVQSGQIEFIYLANSQANNFADNINVLRNLGKIPNQKQIKNICQQYTTELPKLLKKPIDLYECELRQVANQTAFYLEYDGIYDGTRNSQYQFQSTKNQTILLTLTSSNGTFSSNNNIFKKVIDTIEFK